MKIYNELFVLNSDKTTRTVSNSCLSPQGARTPNCPTDMHKSEMPPNFASSPHGMIDVHRFPVPPSSQLSTSPGPGPFPNQQQPNKMGNFISISSANKGPGPPGQMDLPVSNYGCSVRSDNVPLNPNSTSTMSGNPKVSHFDPISSLAQMSQQLTNSVASNLNGQNQNQPAGIFFYSI